MTRDEVERTMRVATTPAELEAAKQLAEDWLAEHPEDEMRIRGGLMEQVEMLSMAYEEGRLP